ncbi:MAG: PhzF family phenazine biosynthesis protein [Thermoplasmata archaeon]|nr:PhzF family phenazine biosynthesis protein [Thermoplasmata archaeon]
MTRRHPLYIVDAFTDQPFRGNPAAVCLLRHDCPDGTLQAIAAEMNLAETAFLRPVNGDLFDSSDFRLRWFTPTIEVPLCGHATLATAKVLFDELGLGSGALTFQTLSGTLRAEARGHRIRLDFPAHPPVLTPPIAGLAGILGGGPIEETLVSPTSGLIVARFGGLAGIRALRPDFARMRRELPQAPLVVATAPGDPPYDFVSRCFAPVSGIDEDPVTGVAHTTLGPYWAAKLGKDRLRAFQASARGGELEVEVGSDGRVGLSGASRIVLRGYLDIPDSEG